MRRQQPMLMESPLTKRVFVVTSYVDEGDGLFTAREKHDVTEQFDALAAMRCGECEPTEEHACNVCGQDLVACDVGVRNGGAFELDPPILFNFCPTCGARVKAVER